MHTQTMITKTAKTALAAATAALLLTGCASDKEAASVLDLKDVNKYVTLGEYKGLSASAALEEVDPAYVDYLVSSVYSQAAAYVSSENLLTDRAVKNGDIIYLDYAGFKDGVQFDGGTATNQTLEIGSGTFIPGFEEGLVGVKPGETVDLDLTFPEAYGNAELAGAAVVFTCTVNGIIPESEVYAAVSNYMMDPGDGPVTNKQELSDYLYSYVESMNNDYYESDLKDSLIDALLANCTFTDTTGWPEKLVGAYKENTTRILKDYADNYGMDLDSLCTYYFGMTAVQYIEQNSLDQLKMDMALYAIAQKEGLVPDKASVESRISEVAVQYGVTLEDITSSADYDEKEYIISFIEDDTIALIRENAVITQ